MIPAVFIGHGSPMNAIEDNADTTAWMEVAAGLPRPKAILCVSAHWTTSGVQVLSAKTPRTIHDFHGFPRELFEQEYGAPGAPELAAKVAELLSAHNARLSEDWGFDHGTWSVLMRMYPRADIPVIQLSLDATASPAEHYKLARELRSLREQDVLILGSGNIVHNLGLARWDATGLMEGGLEWAAEFDEIVAEKIRTGHHEDIVAFHNLTPAARLAVPTLEHFLPLLYVLAVGHDGDAAEFFAERCIGGSISMRSVMIGSA